MSLDSPGSATRTAEREQVGRSTIRQAIYAGSVGNFVEQFDYGLYGYMAPIMASAFFPSSDNAASVLSTYAVLAIAVIVRPLGGTLVGRWGDRVGRRKALLWTIVMMGISTAAIGVSPPTGRSGSSPRRC
jgi:MHS family proline/betaine transporter-like MFS transporter